MGIVTDYLGEDWIRSQLSQDISSSRRTLSDHVWKALLSALGDDVDEAEWAVALRYTRRHSFLLSLVELNRMKARELCRSYTEKLLPVVRKKWNFEYKIVDTSKDGGMGMLVSHAKELASLHGGTWWKWNRYYAHVKYRIRNQPFELHIHQARLIAAASGDRQLARSFARAYKSLSPEKYIAPYEIREAILQSALAEDEKACHDLLPRLKTGYRAGLPKDLVEFPIAVFNNDLDRLAKAVKSTNQMFKAKWNTKNHRQWQEKRAANYGGNSSLAPGTWEQTLERTKVELVANWDLAWWAIAWLNIARWRGARDFMKNDSLYSDWIPRELVNE